MIRERDVCVCSEAVHTVVLRRHTACACRRSVSVAVSPWREIRRASDDGEKRDKKRRKEREREARKGSLSDCAREWLKRDTS